MPSCELGQCIFGRKAVGGYGPMPVPSGLLLVGEAPGRDELAQGRPFVGKSGRLLDDLLYRAGISRAELRITNTCGCVDLDREIRKPLPEELEACRPRLDWEVATAEPRVLILMGNTALSAFMPGFRIGEVYNRPRYDGKYIYVPTYHPAATFRAKHLEPVILEALTLAHRLAEETENGALDRDNETQHPHVSA